MPTKTGQTKRKRTPAKPARTSRTNAKQRARVSAPGRVGRGNEWMELRRSPIQELGGFAAVDIPKRTRIIEYTGEKITNGEADRRYDDEKMDRHHTFLFILNQRTVV